LVYSIHDPTEVAIRKMIEASKRMINEQHMAENSSGRTTIKIQHNGLY
jgi:hypothetical protein